ncbi:hypothetical protein M2171_005259 [Bradyrhizobium japonicum USDA 38]|uniref:hypothetical protein n=1 Tax=Bradyrhizobium japonicum TaxID=375 RepID=UPI000489E350|nr:hypothetical protein [Bradyrhizobium japonicum]MCS3896126.1 hypothetical protein [Bradyrhizobium japonicum USDA 38]MCS3948640.1 hypothetical protein [Bradyrhizobium japonicum]MCW2218628.1 hypothetical protein [Bradyrhizobium japonicum]MCW2343242.1 hypothetical protein [Bradyrhizobium japonicum]
MSITEHFASNNAPGYSLEETFDLPVRLDRAGKKAAIETELGKDSKRSDREIARVVGCDHKTVAAARERMGNSPPTPTQRRHMLISAAEDFSAKFPEMARAAP